MLAQTATKSATQGLVRVGTFAAVPDVVRELGFDAAAVLSDGGFSTRLFDNHENLVSMAARGQLVAHCAATTRCEHFGLLVGQRGGLHSLGLLGLLVRHSTDVQTALSNLVKFFHLNVRGAAVSLTVQGDQASLGHHVHQAGTAARDHIGDGAVAMLFNILRELCGDKLKPIKILLIHRQPEDTTPFRQFFRAPVEFNAGRNAIVFPASWLANALPEVHADVLRLIQARVDEVVLRLSDNFPQQIRAVLHDVLLSGHADLNYVSTLFAMHPRTLRRRLEAAGTRYQKLLDEVRFHMAQNLLENSDLGVCEIAAMLHYSDARAFIRAFRRWSAQTPARWRVAARERPYTKADM